MATAALLIFGFVVVVLFAIIQTAINERMRKNRLERNMWDSRVQAWVADGVSRGYCKRADAHMAYDNKTVVHTLVVQTSAVRRLHELAAQQKESEHGR